MRQALLLVVLLRATTASAQDVNLLEEGGTTRPRAPNVATELLDPLARTRFHLTTRFTFTDEQETFSDSSLWSFEARAVIRIFEGLGVTFGLPFGLDAPKPGDDQFFIGNIAAGVVGGGVIHLLEDSADDPDAPRLGIGGALDIYGPTARKYGAEDCGPELGPHAFCNPVAFVRNTRSYEQELYLERSLAFRVRGHLDFSISILTGELELGLTPAVTVVEPSDFFMLFSWAFRAAARPIDELEPFVEVGSSIRVAGGALNGDDLDTPVRLTVGVRGHIILDPALFVSFNLQDGGVLFGIDLAAAFRGESRPESRDNLDTFDTD
jgi:hypothetical protein